jgi:hypothetical protein
MTTDPKALYPLRFGDSKAVRAWEDQVARQQLEDRARKAGLNVTGGSPPALDPEIARKILAILDPANFWPDAYERLRWDIRDLQTFITRPS